MKEVIYFYFKSHARNDDQHQATNRMQTQLLNDYGLQYGSQGIQISMVDLRISTEKSDLILFSVVADYA